MPGNVRGAIPDFLGQPARRLADNLQAPKEPCLQHLVWLKSASVAIPVSVHSGDPFRNVPQPFPEVSHRVTASRGTRSRIRGHRAHSVTPSTQRPGSCSKSY
jgi:hypothetical protein